jgi:hypothetical protein
LEGITESTLLEELVARVPEMPREDDVTPRRLKNRLKEEGKIISISWAQRFLDKEAEAGRLIKVPVILSKGGNGFVYRKPQ